MGVAGEEEADGEVRGLPGQEAQGAEGGKKMHNRINKLHERALRVVYKDEYLTFEELLEKDQAFTIHERNLQKLAVEMYKVKNGLCPEVMKDLFVLKAYGEEDFILPKVRTVNRGIETIRYRGPKTWAIVPEEIKMAPSLDVFKDKIKKVEAC